LDGSKPELTDTVIIYVPFEKTTLVVPAVDSVKEKVKDKEHRKTPVKERVPVADTSKAGNTAAAAGKKKKILGADCKIQASDYDVSLLRVDILTANTIEIK